MVFLLMKTMFDCVARILIFSTWLYVTNEGRFCSSQTVIAYYNTLIILLFFNIVFNKTDDYCSIKTWIGIYSVFHVIVLQEQGCCELVLGLIVSPKASM